MAIYTRGLSFDFKWKYAEGKHSFVNSHLISNENLQMREFNWANDTYHLPNANQIEIPAVGRRMEVHKWNMYICKM